MVLLGHSATSSQAPITCKFRFPFSAPAPRKRTRPHLASITTDKRRVTAAEVSSNLQRASTDLQGSLVLRLALIRHQCILQVCELWASTEFRQCSQDKAALALEHSYAVAAALLPSHPGTERGSTPRLVGFARHASPSLQRCLRKLHVLCAVFFTRSSP